MLQYEIVYPVTAVTRFGGAPETLIFETVDAWQAHMTEHIGGQSGVVPADENKEHDAMFNEFSIEFKNELTGQHYGSVISTMHMPVPAKTMLQ